MHTTGGYLTQVAFTHKYVFDLHPDTDVYWCTADVGWVTGHSYIVYGPLANGATSVMYEGVPNFPGNDRFWAIVEKYKVTKFYTAPTAIRTFMKWGAEEPAKHDLSSLRVLGSVGEPINPEAWMWYHEHIGGGTLPDRRHVVADRDRRDHDQPAARRHHHQAGLGDVPAAGHRRRGGRRQRRRRSTGGGGYLTLTQPVAGRCCAASGATRSATSETYWSRFEGRYFAGDGAKLDDDGYLWLLGRVDDVMNVSGHRISTTEVESALVVAPGGRRGGGRRRQRRHHRPGDHRLRHPARRQRGRRSTSCATTSPPRSARSPSRRRSTSRPTCPRPAAARSCAACCATSPRAATSATPPRWPMHRSSASSSAAPPTSPARTSDVSHAI